MRSRVVAGRFRTHTGEFLTTETCIKHINRALDYIDSRRKTSRAVVHIEIKSEIPAFRKQGEQALFYKISKGSCKSWGLKDFDEREHELCNKASAEYSENFGEKIEAEKPTTFIDMPGGVVKIVPGTNEPKKAGEKSQNTGRPWSYGNLGRMELRVEGTSFPASKARQNQSAPGQRTKPKPWPKGKPRPRSGEYWSAVAVSKSSNGPCQLVRVAYSLLCVLGMTRCALRTEQAYLPGSNRIGY